jgi:hypothetical protein
MHTVVAAIHALHHDGPEGWRRGFALLDGASGLLPVKKAICRRTETTYTGLGAAGQAGGQAAGPDADATRARWPCIHWADVPAAEVDAPSLGTSSWRKPGRRHPPPLLHTVLPEAEATSPARGSPPAVRRGGCRRASILAAAALCRSSLARWPLGTSLRSQRTTSPFTSTSINPPPSQFSARLTLDMRDRSARRRRWRAAWPRRRGPRPLRRPRRPRVP